MTETITTAVSPRRPAPARASAAVRAGIAGNPTAQEMISTGEAAGIIGRNRRTVDRWVDDGLLAGGRPTDPITLQPIGQSRRWVDARHAVAHAVAAGRAHLVPEKWRYLLPDLPRSS